jgi:CBS domain containing-hemolysin-like protein
MRILAPATSPATYMVQSYLGFRLILVALLIGLNGFFAAAEVALLSVRGSRLRQLAERTLPACFP